MKAGNQVFFLYIVQTFIDCRLNKERVSVISNHRPSRGFLNTAQSAEKIWIGPVAQNAIDIHNGLELQGGGGGVKRQQKHGVEMITGFVMEIRWLTKGPVRTHGKNHT